MLDDMVVFHKTYELVKWMHGLLNNFPKSEKYTLAQRIENTELSVLEGIIQSNNDFDKRAAIERTIVELDKLRIFFRLAKDLQFIPFAQYEEGAKRLDEIGRLLGGWRKKSLPARQGVAQQVQQFPSLGGGAAISNQQSIPSSGNCGTPVHEDAQRKVAGKPATSESAKNPDSLSQGTGNLNIHRPSGSKRFRRQEKWAGQDPEHARAVIRGGNWNNGANAGPFNANLNNVPTNTNNNIGFRCCSSSKKNGEGANPFPRRIRCAHGHAGQCEGTTRVLAQACHLPHGRGEQWHAEYGRWRRPAGSRAPACGNSNPVGAGIRVERRGGASMPVGMHREID